jgi:hypothetical protein
MELGKTRIAQNATHTRASVARLVQAPNELIGEHTPCWMIKITLLEVVLFNLNWLHITKLARGKLSYSQVDSYHLEMNPWNTRRQQSTCARALGRLVRCPISQQSD